MEAHRVIWALANGRWPINTVDHIHGVDAGDGIDNLREATLAQQLEARGGWSKYRVGTRPVRSGNGKWEARIRSGRKLVQVGTFATQDEAYQAYLKAKEQMHSFPLAPHVL